MATGTEVVLLDASWPEDEEFELDENPTPEPVGDPAEHGANLALHLPDGDLATVAEDLIEAFEADKLARKPWEERLTKGLETVGYVPSINDGPIQGMSSVVYPIIAEAAVQFNARALDEIFPAAGPIKTVVVGQKTPEKEEQSQRVEEYMNYQITEEDQGWQEEDDRLLMRLPIDGMAWKKVYRDERLGIQTSKFVSGHDVFAPYSATSTHSVPRLCHRLYVGKNDVRFEQLSGNWRDIPLEEPPTEEAKELNEVQEAINESDGVEPSGYDKDRNHEILEFYADYDLPGFEHVSDEDGEPTGFALPYIITIDLHSRTVLKIVRNWREEDERYRKRINLIPYRFLPGMGFYGFGFLHVIGSLNEAATGALRALLDSAAFSNLQGGFVTSDAHRIKGGALTIKMGEWQSVDATAEEVSRAFYTPPWREPSEALFKLLGMLVEAGKSFTSTTEAMTGAAPSTGPVGTMVALIEQGSKVFSGIHKRLHGSKRAEYKLLAELNAEHVPEDGYPYDPGQDSRVVYAQDFGPEIDVLPVSDPNIFSAQQRIAIAQALLQLAEQRPDLYNVHEAHRRMLEALKVPSIESVLMDNSERPRLDPVSENMLVLNGQPIAAFPGQDHAAHVQVHRSFLAHPGFAGSSEFQEVVGPAMTAHLAEHAAFAYQAVMMEAAGLPYVPVPIGGAGQDEEAEEIPPEAQEEMAVRAAMAGEQFMQAEGLPQVASEEQADPEAMKAQAEIERKTALAAAEQQMRQAEWEADQTREQTRWEAEQKRKQDEWAAEQRRDEEKHAAEMRRAAQKRAEEAAAAKEAAKEAAKAKPKAKKSEAKG